MLIKNLHTTSAFQLFQVLRYVALLSSSIFLAHSGISQNAIGIYETILLLSGSLSYFWINGILTNFLRSYAASDRKREVLSNTVYLVVILTILLAALLLLSRNTVQTYFSLDANYFALFIAFFVLNNIVFLTEYILLATEKQHFLVALGMFHVFVQGAFVAIPAFVYQNIGFVVAGLIVFAVAKFLLLLYFFYKMQPTRLNFRMIRQECITSTPLIISFFLGGFSIYVDGLIVNHNFDKKVFAVYQYGAKEFPLTLLLANALSNSMVAKIATNFQDGLSALKQSSARLMHILFPTTILLLLTSKCIYPLVFSSAFSESYIYFNIYLLLVIPRIVFPQTILIALGKTNSILMITCIEFLLNIFCSLLFLQLFGIPGIAYGTVCAFVVERILLFKAVSNLHVSLYQFTPIKRFLLYTIGTIIAFIISLYVY